MAKSKKETITVPVTKTIPEQSEKTKALIAKTKSINTNLKTIQQGLVRVEEVSTLVDNFKKESEKLSVSLEVIDKDNFTILTEYLRRLREKRIELTGESKIAIAPLTSLAKDVREAYNGPIEEIEAIEEVWKPRRKEYEDAEEKRKEKEKADKQKELNERISVLQGLGMVYDSKSFFYIMQVGDEPNVKDDISIQAVELQAYSPESFERLRSQIEVIKTEKDRIAQEAKEAKEKAEQKLKDDQAALDKQKTDMLNERFEARQDRLFAMGFIEEGDYYINGKTKYLTATLREMEKPEWDATILSIKTTLDNQKIADAKEKRSNLLSEFQFIRKSDGFVYKSVSFEHALPLSVIDDEDTFKSNIDHFTSLREKATIDYNKKIALQKDRADKLASIGISFTYNDSKYFYNSLIPGTPDKPRKSIASLKADIDAMDDLGFDKLLTEYRNFIAKDKVDKQEYDKAETLRQQKEIADSNTDKGNIKIFAASVKEAALKFSFKNDKKKAQFAELLDNFIKNVTAI